MVSQSQNKGVPSALGFGRCSACELLLEEEIYHPNSCVPWPSYLIKNPTHSCATLGIITECAISSGQLVSKTRCDQPRPSFFTLQYSHSLVFSPLPTSSPDHPAPPYTVYIPARPLGIAAWYPRTTAPPAKPGQRPSSSLAPPMGAAGLPRSSPSPSQLAGG